MRTHAGCCAGWDRDGTSRVGGLRETRAHLGVPRRTRNPDAASAARALAPACALALALSVLVDHRASVGLRVFRKHSPLGAFPRPWASSPSFRWRWLKRGRPLCGRGGQSSFSLRDHTPPPSRSDGRAHARLHDGRPIPPSEDLVCRGPALWSEPHQHHRPRRSCLRQRRATNPPRWGWPPGCSVPESSWSSNATNESAVTLSSAGSTTTCLAVVDLRSYQKLFTDLTELLHQEGAQDVRSG